MKYYALIRSRYNYCDTFNYTLGYFKDKDTAEYLALEFAKLYGNDLLSYHVDEIEIDETPIEQWELAFEKLKKDAE
jgi:hypothetical protein